jgi:pyrimidine deaminase RibD-like protein
MSGTGPSESTHLHYLRRALSLARLSPPKPTNFRVGCVIVSFPAADSSSSSSSSSSPGARVGGEDRPPEGDVLSTGYTLELEGNTHAEQNALAKLLAREHAEAEQKQTPTPTPTQSHKGQDDQHEEKAASAAALAAILTPARNVYLYTTLEPCGLRLSGATPCVQRIIATRMGDNNNPDGGIRKVVFGAREPGTFVQDSQALRMLDDAGVPWEYVPGLEAEILAVAKEGHQAGGVASDVGRAAPAPVTNVDDISPEERRRQEQQPRNPKKRMMEVDLSR